MWSPLVTDNYLEKLWDRIVRFKFRCIFCRFWSLDFQKRKCEKKRISSRSWQSCWLKVLAIEVIADWRSWQSENAVLPWQGRNSSGSCFAVQGGSCFAVQGVVLQFRELFCWDHRDKVKKQILISSLQNMMMIDEADDAMVFGNQSPKRKVPEAPASPGPGRKRKPGE